MGSSKVMVATDFSSDAELAVKQARAYAKMTDASVLLVHVVPGPTSSEGEGMLHEGAYSDPSSELMQKLKDIEAILDIPSESRLLRGEPAEAILEAAEKDDVAMIVMGTHGRSGIARMLMGSVAEEVIRKAHCPVMIVKRPRSDAPGA